MSAREPDEWLAVARLATSEISSATFFSDLGIWLRRLKLAIQSSLEYGRAEVGLVRREG